MANLPVIEQEVLIRFKADTKRLKKGGAAASKAMADTAKASKQAATEMNNAAVAGEQIGRIGSALPGQLGTAAGAVGALTGAFKSSKTSMLAFGLGIAGVIGGIIKFAPVIAEWIEGMTDSRTAVEKLTDKLAGLVQAQNAAVKSTKAANAFLFPEEQRFERRSEQQAGIDAEFRATLGRAVRARAEAEKAVRLRTRSGSAIRRRDEEARAEFMRVVEEATETRKRQNAALVESIKLEEAALVLRQRAQEKAEQASSEALLGIKKETKARKENTKAILEQLAAQNPFGAGGGVGLGGQLPTPGGFSEAGGRINAGGIGADSRRGAATVFGGGRAPRFPVSPDQVLGTQEKQLKAMTDAMTDFGTATEQVAEHLGNFESAFGSAFEAFGRGDMTLKEAGLAFVKEGIGEVLRLEAKKQFALGVAAAITLSPKAALHFAASAGLYGAAGAIDGRGGGSGGSGSGGRLAGAAAGSFNGQGNAGGGSSETIIIGTISDNPRRQRRDLQEMMDRSAMESGPGLRIERR